eukprot:TRINITY_DN24472_c0_g1_i1.p2 TRINITY_DN24472_c0_g1~~TRINITY_DN24472_c0_g1_i1.p2  ORF type:complete len:186 (+),score=57.02 TRINITY_DN24472_c0_g1_i1:72-560(+)
MRGAMRAVRPAQLLGCGTRGFLRHKPPAAAPRRWAAAPSGSSPLQEAGAAVHRFRDQAGSAEAAFDRADTNKDGLLQPEEVRALLRSQGCNLNDEQFRAFIQRVDTNGDGLISRDEFHDFLYPVGDVCKEVRKERPPRAGDEHVIMHGLLTSDAREVAAEAA